jgi:hypothetical protein
MRTNPVREAILRTRKSFDDVWADLLERRVGTSNWLHQPKYKGMKAHELEQKLLALRWTLDATVPVSPGCTAFRAEFSGRLGSLDLQSQASDAQVAVQARGLTRFFVKKEGERGKLVDFTTLLLWQRDGMEVVQDFHPGLPMPVSTTPPIEPYYHGALISVDEALNVLHLRYAAVEEDDPRAR